MKRFLALAVALLLALGALAASAETTLTEYAVIPADLNANPIYNSNLLYLDGGNEDALAAMDGTPLTEYAYHTLSAQYQYGWILATRADASLKLYSGLLATDGSTVIPVDYNDISVLNEKWAVGVMLEKADQSDFDYRDFSGDDVYKITTVDIYYLPAGKVEATLPRANYLNARAFGDYINVEDRTTGVITTYDADFTPLGQVSYIGDTEATPQYTTFYGADGLSGLKAPDGTVIIEPTYKVVYSEVRDGYFKVGDFDHTGLCDLDGNLVVPVEYDSIDITNDGTGDKFVINGYACVQLNGKMGYVNVKTGEAFMCEGDYESPYNNGVSFSVKDGDDFIIFSADGVETRVSGMRNVESTDNGLYYKVTDSDGKNGLIDWHGVEVLPREYSDINLTADGNYVFTKRGYGEPATIYAVTNEFNAGAAEESEPAPAEEQPADEGQLSDDAPAPEAMEIESADIGAEGGSVADLLNSAINLLKADPSANSSAAVTLIHNVATKLGDNESVMSILNSVITLLNGDPAGNGAAAVSLLESLIPLL